MKRLELFAPSHIPEISTGDDLPSMIARALSDEGLELEDGDILVVTHKVVSKSEGRVCCLKEITPSEDAYKLADVCGKNPALVQLVLNESSQVVKAAKGVLIMRHRLGFVCANAGIDQSNAGDGEALAVLLPERPDQSAKQIAEGLSCLIGKHVAVLISDSHGRPLRNGTIGVAIGCHGLSPLRDYRGKCDRQGYVLMSSIEALADELCCAASLLMGQSDESIPVVVVRGVSYNRSEQGAQELLRSEKQDLFLQ